MVKRSKKHSISRIGRFERTRKCLSIRVIWGQKQRVGIARALANDPDVLLCDEATSALDPQTTDEILDLLLKVREQQNLTIVLITHEMHVIRRICDEVAVMESGKVIEQGKVSEVFESPQHAVTKRFVKDDLNDDFEDSFR